MGETLPARLHSLKSRQVCSAPARYLEASEAPRYKLRQARPTKLEPFKAYIEKRIGEARPDWIRFYLTCAQGRTNAGFQKFNGNLPGNLPHLRDANAAAGS